MAAVPEQKSVPPYARVKAWLKAGLARQRWPAGTRMPSEAELVARFAVSRMTAGRALRELESEGLVSRAQGRGTFAAPLHRVASTLTIRDLHEEIAEQGHRHEARVELCRAEPAGASVAERLGVARGKRLFHSLIVHSKDGIPLQCEDRWVVPEVAPGYLGVDFTRTTPTHYLLRVAPFWRAHFTIEACAPGAREARLLAIPRSEPCLVVVRRTEDRRRPITLARLVHPGSRYLLEASFAP